MKLDEMLEREGEEMKLDIIYNEDCLEGMKRLPDNSIDLVVTDPSYGSGGRDGSVHLNNPNLYGNRITSDSLIWMTRQYGKILFDNKFQVSVFRSGRNSPWRVRTIRFKVQSF